MSLLENYLKKANIKLMEYLDAPTLSPHVSMGNSKLGKVVNYSRLPIIGCTHNCKTCAKACYAVKHANRFTGTMNAWAENEALIRRDMEKLYAAIDKAFDTAEAGRYHVGGDITSEEQLSLMNGTAAKHDGVPVWTYTTSYEIVDTWLDNNRKADNFAIMRSDGSIKDMRDNPHNMPRFVVVDSLQDIPRGAWICGGNCGVCIRARRGCPYGETTYCVKHR